MQGNFLLPLTEMGYQPKTITTRIRLWHFVQKTSQMLTTT